MQSYRNGLMSIPEYIKKMLKIDCCNCKVIFDFQDFLENQGFKGMTNIIIELSGLTIVGNMRFDKVHLTLGS